MTCETKSKCTEFFKRGQTACKDCQRKISSDFDVGDVTEEDADTMSESNDGETDFKVRVVFEKTITAVKLYVVKADDRSTAIHIADGLAATDAEEDNVIWDDAEVGYEVDTVTL